MSSILPTRSQPKNTFWIFDQSFLHPFNNKYRDATLLLVFPKIVLWNPCFETRIPRNRGVTVASKLYRKDLHITVMEKSISTYTTSLFEKKLFDFLIWEKSKAYGINPSKANKGWQRKLVWAHIFHATNTTRVDVTRKSYYAP